MADKSQQHPALAKLVDREMRRFELRRTRRLDQPADERPEIQPFIAISRTYGSGGVEVARHLAERLHWPLFDREILRVMAQEDETRRRLFEQTDERDMKWIEQTAHGLYEGLYHVNDYFRALTETVLSVARQGNAIFLGRGADLILPRDRGLRVRIVAPPDRCVRELSRRLGVDEEAARVEMERVQRERDDFIRHHFRVEPADPLRGDLVIRLERLSVEQAAELIGAAARLAGFLPA